MNKTALNSQKEKHSMLSLRRATYHNNLALSNHIFLSTLSLRRATCRQASHARRGVQGFLSTLSLRRATVDGMIDRAAYDISIHALLAESDHRLHSVGSRDLHFYPRSPCGERRQTAWPGCLPGYFYPRSPCGERLLANGCGFVSMLISIHALLAESDRVRVQL